MAKLGACLSGGMDSFTAAARVQQLEHDIIVGVFIDYDQPSKDAEWDNALWQARYLEIMHLYSVKVELAPAELLANGEIDPQGVAATYVPHRNLIIAGIVASRTMRRGGDGIIVGWHAQDNPYPDTTIAFQRALVKALSVGSGGLWAVHAPLLRLDKPGVAHLGRDILGLPLAQHSWSCYRRNDIHCGECPSCRMRHLGLGSLDTTEYRTNPEEVDNGTDPIASD